MNNLPGQRSSRVMIGLCGLTLFFLSLGAARAAAVVADFTDGNTSSAVDGYVGKAGNGWGGAWLNPGSGSFATSSATVTSTSPLKPGSGNYLSVSASSNSGTTPAMSINRQYTGVSLTSETEFSFLFRGASGSSSDYRFAMFDSSASNTATSSNNSWAVVATGGVWQMYNGTSQVSTGLAFSLGVTYEIKIVANPAASSYTLKINDASGANLYTSGTLAFRNGASTLGGYLSYSIADTSSASASNFGYSIDSVNIATVPEPGSMMLLSSVLLGWAFVRRGKWANLSK